MKVFRSPRAGAGERPGDDGNRVGHQHIDLGAKVVVVLDRVAGQSETESIRFTLHDLRILAVGIGFDGDGVGGEDVDAEWN